MWRNVYFRTVFLYDGDDDGDDGNDGDDDDDDEDDDDGVDDDIEWSQFNLSICVCRGCCTFPFFSHALGGNDP